MFLLEGSNMMRFLNYIQYCSLLKFDVYFLLKNRHAQITPLNFQQCPPQKQKRETNYIERRLKVSCLVVFQKMSCTKDNFLRIHVRYKGFLQNVFKNGESDVFRVKLPTKHDLGADITGKYVL